jgi:hypothetical protein
MESMHMSPNLRTGLEDLTGDMVYARRTADLGRLALLCYCEIRHWARLAGEERLAHLSCTLVNEGPLATERNSWIEWMMSSRNLRTSVSGPASIKPRNH